MPHLYSQDGAICGLTMACADMEIAMNIVVWVEDLGDDGRPTFYSVNPEWAVDYEAAFGDKPLREVMERAVGRTV